MGYWGKIIGSVAGFAMGGPVGAVVGAALGHAADSGVMNDFGVQFKPQVGPPCSTGAISFSRLVWSCCQPNWRNVMAP
jgi:uncharacterized membrane protein